MKYTEAGGIRLRLSESGDRTLFEVTDPGIGIAPEHHERIFERFWQVHKKKLKDPFVRGVDRPRRPARQRAAGRRARAHIQYVIDAMRGVGDGLGLRAGQVGG